MKMFTLLAALLLSSLSFAESPDLMESDETMLVLTGGDLLVGFPEIEIVGAGTLKMTSEAMTLKVRLKLNCKPTQICPKYVPKPIYAELRIVKVEKSTCGDVTIAESRSLEVDASHIVRVTVTDYSHAICDLYMPHTMAAHYQEISSGPNGKRHEREAQFSFDPKK